MSEAVLNSIGNQLLELTVCKSLYDTVDIQWYVEGPFWRRTNMRFSRNYKTLPDYELGDAKHGKTLKDIYEETDNLEDVLLSYAPEAAEDERDRIEYLLTHIKSLKFRTGMLLSKKYTFDDMTYELYNLIAPKYDYNNFDIIFEKMANLPGEGSTLDKIESFKKRISIPKEKLLDVLCEVNDAFHDMSMKNMHITGNSKPRIRVRHLPNPKTVFISVLFGYDYDGVYYERNFNLDYDWTVENVMEYIGHEIEPGHITYYEKRTQTFIDTLWPEMSVVSLYSPSSAFTEGSARYVSDLCFDCSIDKKIEFEKEHIFKVAGLDLELVKYMKLWHEFINIAGYAKLEVTRNITDGIWSKFEGLSFLKKYGFIESSADETEIEEMLSDAGHYVCHDFSRDTITKYFESKCESAEEKWELYELMCCSHMSMKRIAEGTYFPQLQQWKKL